MTTLHEQGEPCRALDLRPREILATQAVRDTFASLLGDQPRALSAGWPVRCARPATRESDVIIELASGVDDVRELALVIPCETAARWADLALGGMGESGLVGRAGGLGDGECGVLAYVASRMCRPFSPLRVVDVRSGPLHDACVLWPLALESAQGRAAFGCALTPARAAQLVDRHRLTVSVFERAPSAFRVGEVWVSDRWNLSSTSNGLAGEVQLAVEGCATALSAIVAEGRLRAQPANTARDRLEMVLAEQPLCFDELASIGAGEPYPLALAQVVELRDDGGRALARGELVSFRGAVGVRISEA